MNKSELITTLRTTGDEAVRVLRATPQATFEQGRYESGWNGREILAHIASIEWTYRRLIDVAREGAATGGPAPARATSPATPANRTEPGDVPGVPTRTAQGGIGSYNDRQVAKRADVSVEDLIAEFETNRAGTIAAIENIDDTLLQAPIRSAGGITGTLAEVLNAVAIQHVRMHVADIAGSEWSGARF